jgi:hypothetical protein
MAKSKAQLDREIAAVLYGGGKRLQRRAGKHVAHHSQHWKGGEIQSLLFDKQWTPAEAKRWATEHGYKAAKVHVTDNYIRLRQFEPIEGTEKRTIELGQGIKAILEQVK